LIIIWKCDITWKCEDGLGWGCRIQISLELVVSTAPSHAKFVVAKYRFPAFCKWEGIKHEDCNGRKVCVSFASRSLKCPLHQVNKVVNSMHNPEIVSMQKRVSSWSWSFDGQPISIYIEEWGASNSDDVVLFLPALSDVSTTDEFREVAEAVADSGRRAVALDWPGFGLSGRPQLTYTSDVLVRGQHVIL
jgi:hypothetical protein